MTRPRLYNSEAIVLKHLDFGEAHRIVTLYTPEIGKLRVVARSVRLTKSKLGGHLEPLNQVQVSIARGQNLDTATQAEAIRSFRLLKEDLERLSRAFYLADLTDQFTPDELSNYPLYQLLLNTLEALEVSEGPDLLLRCFEMELLSCVGYQPELHWCVECRKRLEPEDHLFCCAMGGVLCPICRTQSRDALIPLSINAMKALRLIQREGYQLVASFGISSHTLEEMERFLKAYIRHLLERDVKSGAFLNLIKSTGAS